VKVVLDTNVLVSALIFPGGPPETVYRSVIEGRVELVTSRPLLLEFGRVLATKFGWESERARQATRQLARLGRVVKPSESVREIAADPADDRVLEAALEGKASVIISGDRHLLRLRSWRGIRILSPSDFVAYTRGARR
jgi:putative PIN family toxin of toxin-antitoxin system